MRVPQVRRAGESASARGKTIVTGIFEPCPVAESARQDGYDSLRGAPLVVREPPPRVPLQPGLRGTLALSRPNSTGCFFCRVAILEANRR
jgi:hypothetical protein